MTIAAALTAIAPMLATGEAFAEEPTTPPEKAPPASQEILGTDFTAFSVGENSVIKKDRCNWSTHNQVGGCVTIKTPDIKKSDLDKTNAGVNAYFARFRCPADYPFPFEGAFSGNPTWIDHSYKGFAAVKAVNSDNVPLRFLSYSGVSKNPSLNPGYVTITTDTSPGDDSYWAGIYQCSDVPANPY